ncbi:hypothetical protein [Pampinifervens florentissimum]|uniref:hypothetical protein n=1 Tax=Pampinifervens florentissimum TaxID=1632019 RepID=UPI0013B47C09|nr:hypothetical protein [Hydrogenobacter sp. T-8]QID33326.1 hypothetical protein G3M65_05910 [Hydrogenobacter sp. T-8]
MENLINLLLFLGKLLLLMVLVGLPLLLIIVFIADRVYRKVGPRYEELRDRRIRELEEEEKKSEDKKGKKKT